MSLDYIKQSLCITEYYTVDEILTALLSGDEPRLAKMRDAAKRLTVEKDRIDLIANDPDKIEEFIAKYKKIII